MFSPQLQYQLQFDRRWPMRVAFLDSHRQVAASNLLGEILVWNLPETPPSLPAADKNSGDEIKREAPDVLPAFQLIGHTNEVVGLKYDPAKKRLYSASWDRTIKVWSLEGKPTGTAELVLDLGARQEKIRRSKTNKAADVSLENGTPVETYGPLATLEGHAGRIRSMAISHDYRLLVTGDSNSEIILWDLDGHQIVKRWTGHKWNQVVGLAFSRDNKSIAACEYRYKRDSFDLPIPALKLWNLDGTEKLDILKVLVPSLDPKKTGYSASTAWRKYIAQGLIALAFSPDGKILAAAQGGEFADAKTLLIDPSTGKLLKQIAPHKNGVNDVLFTGDGKHLITSGRDTTVRISQIPDGKEVATASKPRGGQSKDSIYGLSLSADEKYLACSDIGGVVAIWQLNA